MINTKVEKSKFKITTDTNRVFFSNEFPQATIVGKSQGITFIDAHSHDRIWHVGNFTIEGNVSDHGE